MYLVLKQHLLRRIYVWQTPKALWLKYSAIEPIQACSFFLEYMPTKYSKGKATSFKNGFIAIFLCEFQPESEAHRQKDQ